MSTKPSGESRRVAVDCGTPLPAGGGSCDEPLWITYGPAASLWCPWHGHVLDVLPSPPLVGSVHLNYGGGKGEWIELGAS